MMARRLRCFTSPSLSSTLLISLTAGALACNGGGGSEEAAESGPATLTAEGGSSDEIGSESAGESATSTDSSGSTDDTTSQTSQTSESSTDTSASGSETTTDPTTESSTGESTSADTSSTDGMDSMTTTTTTTGDIPCDEFQVTLNPLPPNVMLVLDKSRSMFINFWDHDNNGGTPTVTRWSSLHGVVNNIVNGFDDKINFGSILFPSTAAQNVYGGAACVTSDFPDVTCGPFNGPAILASIPAANVVNSYGGTPAATGIQTAYDHLQTLDPEIPAAMILVTDGAANCSQTAQNNFDLFEVYDTALPTIVAQAHADGIDTYVVGVDIANMVVNDGVGGDPNNINPSQKLNEVAAMGGTGSFFNSQDQAELAAALTAVVDSVKTCIIPLEVEPVFPEFTKVIVAGMEWPMINDCATEDGWYYSNQYDTIELCGDACDALKDAGDADVEYYCNPG